MQWSGHTPRRLPPIIDVVNEIPIIDPPTREDNEDFIEAIMMLNNPFIGETQHV